MVAAGFGDGVSSEDDRAGEEIVGDRAERIEICASIERLGRAHRLGREIHRRAEDRARTRQTGKLLERSALLERRERIGRGAELFHEAEVDDLGDVDGAASRAEDDVRRLDVAMDEADRVRLAERAGNLRDDVCDACGRHRAGLRDDLFEIAPYEQLHRVVEDAVGGSPVIEDGHDVSDVTAAP
jgi:hypothetical protein